MFLGEELQGVEHGLNIFLHGFVVVEVRRNDENVVVELIMLNRNGAQADFVAAIVGVCGVLLRPIRATNVTLWGAGL